MEIIEGYLVREVSWKHLVTIKGCLYTSGVQSFAEFEEDIVRALYGVQTEDASACFARLTAAALTFGSRPYPNRGSTHCFRSDSSF